MNLLKKLAKRKAFDGIIESIENQKKADYISSGSYSLNSILSGNTYTGIPDDCIVALCGQSNTGKSYFLAHFIKHAIQDLGYTDVIIFDSERAVREEYYERIGCDITKIYRVPVGSVTEFRNKAVQIIEEYYKEKSKDEKLLVALDSLGNLASDKEIADSIQDKDAADMGTNAKFQNSAFRVMNSLASKHNFPFIFTNHVYMNPSDQYDVRGQMSGGAKAIYNSQVILHFTRLSNKAEVDDPTKMKKDGSCGKKKGHIGIKMKIATIKNRCYPEEKEIVLDLRFDEGINPYSGLLPLAIQSGVIENKSRGYLVTETGKTVFEKDMYNEEVFTPKAMEKINEWLSKNGYNSLNIFNEEVTEAIQGENIVETQGK